MNSIAIFFKRGRLPEYPAKACLRRNGQIFKQLLYDQTNKKNLSDINKDLEIIRNIFNQALLNNTAIITNDCKTLRSALSTQAQHIPSNNIYDIYAPTDEELVFEKLVNDTTLDNIGVYQHILFNAGTVYDYLSENPIYINYTPQQVNWSMATYSGRSKCLGFNIQGYHHNDFITRDGIFQDKILIHFDWICADLRIASHLSGDKELEEAFRVGDPYEYLLIKSEGMFKDRQETKIALLKAVNSLDFDNGIFKVCYKGLREWMLDCAHKLTNEMPLESILGKTFKIEGDKTVLSAMNGVLQGSIAHAMQIVIHNIYKIFPRHLICDIHDSLVLSCENDKSAIKHMISRIIPIMCRPFGNYLKEDLFFPLRYGVGKKWKSYKYSDIQRETHEQEIPKN